MKCVCVNDPLDRGFPFDRSVFEDRQVLYHGTSSTYSPKIELVGMAPGDLPFDSIPFIAISVARKKIGWGSFLAGALEEIGEKSFSSRALYFATSFWGARAYATDCGGELLRKTIEDATTFERICATVEARETLIRHWTNALHIQPNHGATMSAIDMLKNTDALQSLCEGVVAAREKLLSMGHGGYPVVYAIRVEPEWFGDRWETYLHRWKAGIGSDELPLSDRKIGPNRIVGRASYPKGTDANFMPTWCTTWLDAENMVEPA